MQHIQFKGIPIKAFKQETIQAIIQQWLGRVELLLSNEDEFYTESGLVQVFYRYIQLNQLMGIDKNAELFAQLSIQLDNENVAANKRNDFIKMLQQEIKAFEEGLSQDPIAHLLYNFFKENSIVRNARLVEVVAE